MLLRLLLALICIPLVELFLLLRVAQLTGPLTTVALVIVTGIIGTILARRQGLRVWSRFRAAMAEGRMPAAEIQDGLLIALAAVLLVTPGLLTDTTGFLLLVPGIRRWVRRRLGQRLAGRFRMSVNALGSPPSASFRNSTIDAAGVRPLAGDDPAHASRSRALP